jgi:hypothetical protein
VRDAFALQQVLRLAAGPAMATVLVCVALGGVLPRRLSRAAIAIAVPLALTPAAALTEATGVHVAAGIAFALHLAWIWLASLWLGAGGIEPAGLVRRAAFVMLVVAAGLVGVALLLLPDRTGAFFAWELRPASLAGFAGGVYVGSAVVYGAALRAPWWRARALVAAAVVLSVSVLVITLVHREPFDFGRLQAWAWLVLFVGFAAVTTALLLKGGPRAPGPGVPLPSWARGLLGTVAVALAELALILWIDPAPLPALGGRFAGSWAAMLAVLAGWAAVVNRRDEARLPALALVALPAGALAGAVLTGEAEPLQVAGLLALTAGGAAVLRLSPR